MEQPQQEQEPRHGSCSRRAGQGTTDHRQKHNGPTQLLVSRSSSPGWQQHAEVHSSGQRSQQQGPADAVGGVHKIAFATRHCAGAQPLTCCMDDQHCSTSSRRQEDPH